MTVCNGCGDCCRAIVTTWEKRRLDRLPSNDANKLFISAFWRRISRREAESRRPLLAAQAGSGSRFYDCAMFDHEMNQCVAYELRPPICTGFPWYGQRPTTKTWALDDLPDCSYRQDLETTIQRHG